MPIKGVIYEHCKVTHQDERRKIISIFNGSFNATQSKIAVVGKDDVVLGSHYHNYAEFYFLYKGKALFTLEHIDTKEREQYSLKSGDTLLIPANIAHKAKLSRDAILFGYSEKPYKSLKENNHPYEIK